MFDGLLHSFVPTKDTNKNVYIPREKIQHPRTEQQLDRLDDFLTLRSTNILLVPSYRKTLNSPDRLFRCN